MIEKALTDSQLDEKEAKAMEQIAELGKDLEKAESEKTSALLEVKKAEISLGLERERLKQKLQGIRRASKDMTVGGIVDKVAKLPTEKTEHLQSTVKKYELQAELAQEDIAEIGSNKKNIESDMVQFRVDNDVLRLYEDYLKWADLINKAEKFFGDNFISLAQRCFTHDQKFTQRCTRLGLPVTFQVVFESKVTLNNIDTVSQEWLVDEIAGLRFAYPKDPALFGKNRRRQYGSEINLFRQDNAIPDEFGVQRNLTE